MESARVIAAPEFRIGTVDARLFGSFIEHLGRVVYNGIYEHNHPTADDIHFRVHHGAKIAAQTIT